MRQTAKDIQIAIDGSPVGFSLTKLDVFSGVALLRLLLCLESAGGSTSSGTGSVPRTTCWILSS